MKKKWVVWGITAALMLPACAEMPQSNTGKGALYGTAGGAAAGALAGQLIGHDTKSTLLGAAIGAAVGGLTGAGVGHMMDKQQAAFQQELANSRAVSVSREPDVTTPPSGSGQQQAPPQIIALTLKGDVFFDTNSAVVKPGTYSEFDRIAQVMVQYPQTQITIEGHTDSRGSADLNQRLSEQRAEAVKSQLVERGVASNRIETVGYGKTRPIATNQTEAGRQLNRRVEIKIKPVASS